VEGASGWPTVPGLGTGPRVPPLVWADPAGGVLADDVQAAATAVSIRTAAGRVRVTAARTALR
jgi:hypothetical protein